MSRETALRNGRRKRRANTMRSRCRITRPAGWQTGDFNPETGGYDIIPGRVWNPDTGQYDSAPPEVVYEGPCHFKAWSGMGARSGDVADREMTGTLYDLALPIPNNSEPVSVSDTVTMLECDPEWAEGIEFPVVSIELSDDRNAQHITITDQARGTVDYA